LDHVGPLTRTTMDAALVLQTIAGYDRQDTASIDAPGPDFTEKMSAPTNSLRLGIPRAYFYEELHPEIQAVMEAALFVLKSLTKSQQDIAPLATDATYSSWMDHYPTVLVAEAYAYHKDYIEKSPDLYQTGTLKRLRPGSEIAATKYIKSRREMELVRRSIVEIFENVDLLITPTVRIPPFTIADLQADLDTVRARELAMLHNTRALNFPGLPTISIPCGFTSSRFPVGMQITGRSGDEATVCRLANAYEQATDWHKREPHLD
jgi:aspartyl-tRNA(Asn)/glutamyl-tRNA(Gln) amidotransferase subunit A